MTSEHHQQFLHLLDQLQHDQGKMLRPVSKQKQNAASILRAMFVTLSVVQCPQKQGGSTLLQAAWKKKQSRHSDTAQWSQKQLLRVQLMQHHQFLHLQLVLHHQG